MRSIIYPTPEAFVKAIAKPFEGEAFALIGKEFSLAWSDADRLAEELHIYNFSLPKFGIRLTFEDEGVILDREYHDAGEGPFVLTKCTFWGHQDEAEIYPGPLWKGIDFNDSVGAVQAKIGPPTKINERSGVYSWDLPDFKLTVQWVDSEKIRVITYWMKKD